VVGGQVTPDTIVVFGGVVIQFDTGDKVVMTVVTPAGTRNRSVPDELRRSAGDGVFLATAGCASSTSPMPAPSR
jgi:hypothetical protein